MFIMGNGQGKSYHKIDSSFYSVLLTTHTTGKFEEGITKTEELMKQSQRLNYEKGIATGYINIANILCNLNKYEASLQYAALAEKTMLRIKDNDLKATVYIESGKVYLFLGLYETSLNYYNKAITASQKIEDTERKINRLHYAYACKADNFSYLNQHDSTYIYFHKAYNAIADPITAANIADFFIVNKKSELDSAEHYLKSALYLYSLKKNKYPLFQKLIVFQKYGDFFYTKREYKRSLDYYYQSLALSRQIKRADKVRDMYQLIHKSYKALNDVKKTKEYIVKYAELNDSLDIANKRALNVSVNKLLKDRDNVKKKISDSNYTLVGCFCIIFLLLSVLGYRFYKKNKKETELQNEYQQKKITQQEIEKINMECKVNDAYHEVLQLAKNNDSSFLARFKEVYPEFCKKILILYPDIVSSELTFCAYLKLNLSTKDIADHIFISKKAVQVRKSRIRKKLNISSDEDLYIWINNL
ncbi:tetratricopeptide repeat protein [Chryseobacterium sp. SIMBA_038]